MTQDEAKTVFLEALVKIAPDLEADDILDEDHIQDDLELDSMDVLNLVAAIHVRLGVDIPEKEYVEIATPALAAAYLNRKMAV